MLEFFDLEVKQALDIIFYIFSCFGFFVGIVLMVSPEAFDALNKSLSKEYGLKTRLLPKIELKAIYILDKVITKDRKHGVMAGIFIAVFSFVLILFKN
ncbi:MAG: hypothetical protein P9M07_03170 [Candidatus Aceula meridiana]|nr:hypothetical protein [Candidatus Aceula meridiana]